MEKKRNVTLDVLKLLASYMVVFIHVLFYGKIGDVVDALARFAVPLFFLSSGYFSYCATSYKIKSRIQSLFRLLIFSAMLYSLWSIRLFIFDCDFIGLLAFLEKKINIDAIIKLLVFNVPVFSGHIWYLYAMIYVYIIFYYTTKYAVSSKVLSSVSVFFLILHLVLGEVLSAVGIVFPKHIVRNFALMGLPFFSLGLFTKKHERIISEVPNYIIIICIVLGILETIISRLLFRKNELYVGSLLILFGLVVVFVKKPSIKYPRLLITVSECSTYIYIFHKIIATILESMYDLVGINYSSSVACQMIHPLLVCLVSTFLSYGINQITRKCSTKNLCTTLQ